MLLYWLYILTSLYYFFIQCIKFIIFSVYTIMVKFHFLKSAIFILNYLIYYTMSNNILNRRHLSIIFCYGDPDISVVPSILRRYLFSLHTHSASYYPFFSWRTCWPPSPKDVHDHQEKSIAFICEQSWSLIPFFTASRVTQLFFTVHSRHIRMSIFRRFKKNSNTNK